jgi:N-acetylmuramoyl-L-alanine amidase CwlA
LGLAPIPDDAWVRYDPTVYDGGIGKDGVELRFFDDNKVWLTKYKDVKNVKSARSLETKLYRKNLWKKVDGKFKDGGTLRVVSNVDDAKFSGVTNKSDGVRQWYIERSIPAEDLREVKRIPGGCKK